MSGDSGGYLSSTYTRSQINRDGYTMESSKFDYFFGNVDAPAIELRTTDPIKWEQLNHNYQRSQQLKQVLGSDGYTNTAAGRENLLSLFDKASGNPEVARHVAPHGTTITRVVETPRTIYQVKFYHEQSQMSGIPKIVSVIPKVKN